MSDYFKEQRAIEADRAIRRADVEYFATRIEVKVFDFIIRRTVKNDSLNDRVAQALEQRLDADQIGDKALYQLLVKVEERHGEGPNAVLWRNVRQEVMSYLERTAGKAMDILKIAKDLGYDPDPQKISHLNDFDVDERKVAGGRAALVIVDVGMGERFSAPHYSTASGKKAAARLAANSFWHAFVEGTLVNPDEIEKPTRAKDTEGTGRKGGNIIGQFVGRAHKTGWTVRFRTPANIVELKEQGIESQIVILSGPGIEGSIEMEGRGRSKNGAQHEAVKRLLSSIDEKELEDRAYSDADVTCKLLAGNRHHVYIRLRNLAELNGWKFECTRGGKDNNTLNVLVSGGRLQEPIAVSFEDENTTARNMGAFRALVEHPAFLPAWHAHRFLSRHAPQELGEARER